MMSGTILSMLMLAGFALGAGGLYLLRRRGERKQGWLMLVAAAVMFGNVAIASLPPPSFKSGQGGRQR